MNVLVGTGDSKLKTTDLSKEKEKKRKTCHVQSTANYMNVLVGTDDSLN